MEIPAWIGVRKMRELKTGVPLIALAAVVAALFLLGCQPAGDSTEPATGASTPIAEVAAATAQPPASPVENEPLATSTAAATAAQPTSQPSPSPLPSSPDPASPTAEPRGGGATEAVWEIQEYPVPPGSRPHDVAPAPDGTVWYTAQATGELGRLDPSTGETDHIDLGAGSAPHGVIVGPDGRAWVTDGGLNAIVRVDPDTEEVQVYPLPPGSARANLNTATFDASGVLWFTGQNGVYGSLDPRSGAMRVHEAPMGRGPYGIATAPDGSVYYASLAGSHIARIDVETGEASVIQPPTSGQGARRVWADSEGRIWVSEWNAGQVGIYDPESDSWQEWRLPGDDPRAYAVYVDDQDGVWLTDFGTGALVLFDPEAESFTSYELGSPSPDVRQLLGREGEVWGAESGADALVVARRQE